MRYMILLKSTPALEAGTSPPAGAAPLAAAMAAYHEALAAAGVLLDAAALQPSRTGWRIHCDGARRTVVEGPFPDATALVAGVTTIQVRSREEALEWSRRFPHPAGALAPTVIEVRRLGALDDVAPGDAPQRADTLDTPSPP